MSESVWSRHSAIGIVTRLQAVHQRDHGSIPGRGQIIFSFQMHTVRWYRGCFLGDKAVGV